MSMNVCVLYEDLHGAILNKDVLLAELPSCDQKLE